MKLVSLIHFESAKSLLRDWRGESMEDVSKKWICPKLMGDGEVTQKFGGGG